ncbi:molybdopterin biosynthesis protein [Loktanella sp. 3ANDIMAR09]|uniref:molybdopterin-binding protein n=1 Tax=Loktanella sp. 3ANDIMAR09 TaxID=1225657 RepID=UPI0006FEBBDB|nr:molybdopterin-binding protein [Loktanella sp. 3ANDIMAR09]KQI68750.1 molybdopterin biosynthesis protein [Loktanella sp. 3ANDIMAR09]
MRFGPVRTADALGAILAHSLDCGTTRIRKGTVLSAAHLAELAAAGHDRVTVALLAADDLDENRAAAQLGAALVPEGRLHLRVTPASTGRVNIVATRAGVVGIAAEAINAVNAVSPMITVATLAPLTRVAVDTLIATIKVISFGVPRADLDRACQAASGQPITLHPPRLSTATLIETTTDATTPNPKGRRALATRLARLGVTLSERVVVSHDASEIAAALHEAPGDLALILTASATSDVADTAPTGVMQAGGRMIHYGMPVDPGNLLFIAQLGEKPVIGLPGCARSPALNGADWVLERVICGLPVGPAEIAAMGVGGLLKEMPSRPLPRRPITAR